MSIEPQLRLMWLASPALPIGGFAYSEGLEAAVEQGLVHDGDSAAGWLSQQLHFVARGDLAAIAALIPAWQSGDTAELARVATWLRITRDSAEARLQSEQMGQSLLLWLRQQDAGLAARVERLPVSHALVMSLALSAVDLPLRQVLQSQAFGWAENQVQAALKAVPLGQNAGQCVLARLAAEIPAAVEVAISTEHRQVFVPRLAILAARHETQYSRLFRS
ncbi:MAG TPA: urease accessory UreF family protein [Burkholderiaceae bacterium]